MKTKAYVQYLDYDLSGKMTEPCGDRAVVILDGRNSLKQQIADAIEYNGCRRRNYPAFEIRVGTFTDYRTAFISGITVR